MGAAGRVLACVAALAGAFLIAAISLRPPAGGEISANALMSHIRVIAKAPHPTGSPANGEVRAYLVDELRKIGIEPQERVFPFSPDVQRSLARWKVTATEGVNLVGVLPGSNRALDPIVLMAHYDSVPGSPGAADDAAGVAGVLGIAHAMRGENRRDLVLLLTDAEEPGLAGARAFFAGPDRVGAVVNLESRGGGGRAAMFQTGDGQAALTRRFAGEVRHPTAHSVTELIYRYMPNDTDFSPAKKRGLPGFNFAFIGRPGLYHSPMSTPDRVQQASVTHMANQALAAVRALDSVDTLPSGGQSPVYSDVFGLFMISHAAVFGWLPITVAALAMALAAAFAIRREDWRWREFAVSLPVAILLFPIAGAALFGMNIVAGEDAYLDRLAKTGRLELQAILLCLAVALALPRKAMGLWTGWLALQLVVLALAVALQLAAPQAAPLFAWPLMVVALTSLPLVVSNAPLWRIPPLVVLVVAAAFALHWAHLLFVGAGQDLPSAIAPLLLVAVMAVWPFLHGLPGGRKVAVVALAFLLASVAVAVSTYFAPVSPMAATY